MTNRSGNFGSLAVNLQSVSALEFNLSISIIPSAELSSPVFCMTGV